MALIWNEKEQVFDVVPKTCPMPWTGDDGSAKSCVRNGNCGCDESAKPENKVSNNRGNGGCDRRGRSSVERRKGYRRDDVRTDRN